MHAPQAIRDDPLYEPLLRPRAAAERRRVLLAEDDLDMLRLLARVLEREGYDVVTAEDGIGLLDRLEATTWADPAQHFDAVVADINIPGLSALDILAGLGSAGAATPVVLITASGDEATRAEARQLGALAVLDKPLVLDELRRVVRRAVGR
ncbi:MAG TPA: response regulator [Candidatus Binatia bacterium]|nr:response regulator [Candidatus Binatia bacterium]